MNFKGHKDCLADYADSIRSTNGYRDINVGDAVTVRATGETGSVVGVPQRGNNGRGRMCAIAYDDGFTTYVNKQKYADYKFLFVCLFCFFIC